MAREQDFWSHSAESASYINDVAKGNASREADLVSSTTAFTKRDATTAGKIDAEFRRLLDLPQLASVVAVLPTLGLTSRRIDTWAPSPSHPCGRTSKIATMAAPMLAHSR